jgi:hypothetical protein
MPKRSTVYINDEALIALGTRKASGVINQTLSRVAIAGDSVKITKAMTDYFMENCRSRGDNFPYYPDQKAILTDFSDKFGLSMSETVIALDKIEWSLAEGK